MRIVVNRKHFLGLLDRVASAAASGRVTHEVLKFVRVDAETGLTLQATDGEVSIVVDGDAEIESPGSVLVDPAKMATLLKESSAESVTISKAANGVEVSAGKSRFTLPSPNADEFPRAKKHDGQWITIHAEQLIGCIHRTRFACDVDSTRYQLGGVLIESQEGLLRLVATDGRRLSAIDADAIGGKLGASCIVPQKGLQLVAKAFAGSGEVRVLVEQNTFAVCSDSAYVETRTVEGRFPAYEKVIPSADGYNRIPLQSGPFVSMLRQASVVADPDSRGVDLQFSPGELAVVCAASDRGKVEASMPVDTSLNLKSTMDARYVLDFAERCGGDEVFDLLLIDGSRPALFVLGTWRYVVMPMARS